MTALPQRTHESLLRNSATRYVQQHFANPLNVTPTYIAREVRSRPSSCQAAAKKALLLCVALTATIWSYSNGQTSEPTLHNQRVDHVLDNVPLRDESDN
jgi:hypothetical protein